MHRYPTHSGLQSSLTCVECRRPWLDPSERWRLKVTDEEPRTPVPYCLACATREFGPPRARRRRGTYLNRLLYLDFRSVELE